MARDGHLEETLRRIIANALHLEVEDPRVGYVTVSEVRLNRDRTVARVFYTVLGDEEERRTSLEGLKRCRGYLRQIIGDQTRLRTVPELRFTYDDSLDRSFRVEETLDRLATERAGSGDEQPDGPTGPDDGE